MNVHKLEQFSFKDLLAIAVIGGFGCQVYHKDYQMVELLIPLVAIVLGGYFVSEGYTYFMDKRNTSKEENGSGYPV